MQMNSRLLALAAALLLGSPLATAAPTWVDWTSTTAGTMGSTVVTLSSTPMFSTLDNGTQYYNNVPANDASTYAGLAPFDVIQLYDAATITLSFSDTVGSLYMSMVSVGNWSQPVRYQFNDPFSVVSSGGNIWGDGYFEVNGTGDIITGTEHNGILLISGNFGPSHPLVFTVMDPEAWHGFNVAAVPEPETYAMMLAGLGMVGFMARRRKL
jgi:hypothetical protein